MPERQIPWRRVAERFSGTFRVQTGIRTSRFLLSAQVDTIQVEVRGESQPFSLAGGTTEIRAFASVPLDVVIYLARDARTLPIWRRFFVRDVVIHDAEFDAHWVINARREAHAQAFLGREVRRLIQAVPPATISFPYGGGFKAHYDYDLRGRDILARTANFETSDARLAAAMEAAAAMVKQPMHLLASWKQLALDLDGRLEINKRWRMDGSTRIRFPSHGSPVLVSPRVVSLGRRRDRLRTRVSCHRSGTRGQQRFRIHEGHSTAELGDNAKAVAVAMADAGAVILQGDGRVVFADLDGNVTDPKRILAAASAVAILARDTDALAGPYR